MPDVFDRYFEQFGKKRSDYYKIQRLDPSYRVYWPDEPLDIPADINELKALFESLEPGAAASLDKFLKEAAYKYKTGVQNLVFKPGQSLLEFLDTEVIKGVFRLDVFNSMQKHIHKFFKHPRIRQLLEFPVLFLGALPNTLLQTAVLKPSCCSKKVKNLFFTGQLTVPGPGVPPSLISGEVVAGEVIKKYL